MANLMPWRQVAKSLLLNTSGTPVATKGGITDLSSRRYLSPSPLKAPNVYATLPFALTMLATR